VSRKKEGNISPNACSGGIGVRDLYEEASAKGMGSLPRLADHWRSLVVGLPTAVGGLAERGAISPEAAGGLAELDAIAPEAAEGLAEPDAIAPEAVGGLVEASRVLLEAA
ncbi:MAG TPA: hypothetical protein VF585_05720, partial [Chthoniobacterales bacterium]|jgi:hypothetical protein